MTAIPKSIKEHPYGFIWIPAWIRPRRNQMFSCVSVGTVGSGKSWAMLSLAELLDRNNDGETRFSIDRVAFSASRFQELMTIKWPKGTVVILDDAGLALYSRDAMTTINKILGKTFQSHRYKNLIILLSLPVFTFLDSGIRSLMNGYVKMQEIDYENKQSIARYRLLNTDERNGEIYYKTPMKSEYINDWEIPIRRVFKVPFIRFDKPSDELIKQYEDAKTIFMDKRNITAYAEIVKAENPTVKVRKSFDQLIEEARAIKEQLKTKGGYSITMIMMRLKLGIDLSTRIKQALEYIDSQSA